MNDVIEGNLEVKGSLTVDDVTNCAHELHVAGAASVGGAMSVGGTLTVDGDPITPGSVGPQGETGVQGETGPQGEKGAQGEQGPSGADGSDGVLPAGVILMWHGTIASIPNGWALCDGEGVAPDLRDRFVTGAGNAYSVNSTGGKASVTLETDDMPRHDHDITVTDPGHNHSMQLSGDDSKEGHIKKGGYSNNYRYETEPCQTQKTGVSVTASTSGGGQAHENLPPYYALYFIIKL